MKSGLVPRAYVLHPELRELVLVPMLGSSGVMSRGTSCISRNSPPLQWGFKPSVTNGTVVIDQPGRYRAGERSCASGSQTVRGHLSCCPCHGSYFVQIFPASSRESFVAWLADTLKCRARPFGGCGPVCFYGFRLLAGGDKCPHGCWRRRPGEPSAVLGLQSVLGKVAGQARRESLRHATSSRRQYTWI